MRIGIKSGSVEIAISLVAILSVMGSFLVAVAEYIPSKRDRTYQLKQSELLETQHTHMHCII